MFMPSLAYDTEHRDANDELLFLIVFCAVCLPWISCKTNSHCLWSITWAACNRKQVRWPSTV